MTENTGWDIAPMGHNSGDIPVEPSPPKYEVKYKGQPDTEEPEAFRLRRNAEVQHWLDSRVTFTNAQELERSHRSKVFATLFPAPKKGTNRYDIGGGYSVKLTYTLTYSLGDKDKVDAESGEKVSIAKQIQELEAKVAEMGEVYSAFFEGIVSWVPTISGSAYEKLDPDSPVQKAVRDAISEHLTITPAKTPTLTWEEPKEPKG